MGFSPTQEEVLFLRDVESRSASAAPGEQIEVLYSLAKDIDERVEVVIDTKIGGVVVDTLETSWDPPASTPVRTITVPQIQPGDTQICVEKRARVTDEMCIPFTVLDGSGENESRMVIDNVTAEPAPTPRRAVARVTVRNEVVSGSGRPLAETVTIQGFGDVDEEQVTLDPGQSTTFERLMQAESFGNQEVCASVGGQQMCDTTTVDPGNGGGGGEQGGIDPALLALAGAGVAFVVWRRSRR